MGFCSDSLKHRSYCDVQNGKHDFKVCLTAKKLKIIKSYGKTLSNKFSAVTSRILEGKIIEATNFMRAKYLKNPHR